jgi:hypothetical protein
MGGAFVLVGLLVQGAPVIRAEGTEDCPHPTAVSQRLAGLLRGGEAEGEGPPDVVELSVVGAELRVRLSRPDGSLVAERLIPRSSRCAELADAAAALVAAWEADLRPGVPLPPPARPSPPAALLAPQPPLALQAPVPPPERAVYELGALPALWLGGGQFSFAGAVRAGVWSRRAPVGMTVALSATFPVETAEGGALTRWRRHALSGGVMGRLRHRWLFVDGIAEGVLGWMVLDQEGAGGASATFDPGLTIGLRAGSRIGRRFELYASLAAWGAAWNKPAVDGVRTAAVPHWGLLTGVGGSFLFGL